MFCFDSTKPFFIWIGVFSNIYKFFKKKKKHDKDNKTIKSINAYFKP